MSRAPTLKTLSKISGVELCGKTFRQLEWMVGQHVRWRLLAPTPVSFAALLAHYVVTDADLTTRHPKFVRRIKRDGAKMLEAYLDLTLSGECYLYLSIFFSKTLIVLTLSDNVWLYFK